MRVEGRGLEHFGERKLHFVGKRGQMGGRNLLVGVLDEVEMLDQEIAPPWPVAEQKGYFFGGPGSDLTPLGGRFGASSSLAGMFERADLLRIMTHGNYSFSPVRC